MKSHNRVLDPPRPELKLPRRPAEPSAHAPDFGVRCQQWLRDRHALAFGPMLDAPAEPLAHGGACLAWRYRSQVWARWGQTGVWAGALALLVGAIGARGPAVSGSLAWETITGALAAIAVSALVVAAVQRGRAREEFAVAWDQGPRPLSATQHEEIVRALRTRWPSVSECWLITRRPLDVVEEGAGLRVFLVAESDLPRTSVRSRAA